MKRPKVLLLDEPMAALDSKLRMETQFELANLQEKLGTTFVIVTHDQEEAMTLSDRIAVMDGGKVLQVAPPAEGFYEQPTSCWVANFVGETNLIEGIVRSIESGALIVDGSSGEILRVAASDDIWPGMRVWVAVRPEKVRISLQKPPGAGKRTAWSRAVSATPAISATSSCVPHQSSGRGLN